MRCRRPLITWRPSRPLDRTVLSLDRPADRRHDPSRRRLRERSPAPPEAERYARALGRNARMLPVLLSRAGARPPPPNSIYSPDRFQGRTAWQLEVAPLAHEPHPLQLVIDAETGLLRQDNTAFNTFHE